MFLRYIESSTYKVIILWGKSYSRRTAGVTEKNATFAFSQKTHTQMQHLNESQRYTIYRMRKDKKTQSEIV